MKIGDIAANIAQTRWNSHDFPTSDENYEAYHNNADFDVGVIRAIGTQSYLIEIAPGQFTAKGFKQVQQNENVSKGRRLMKQFTPAVPVVNDTYKIF